MVLVLIQSGPASYLRALVLLNAMSASRSPLRLICRTCFAGLHPFPFHLLCVLMHALASMLVLALCQHLFAVLEGSSAAATQTAPEHPPSMHITRPTQEPSKRTNSLWQQLLMWQTQPQLWQLPRSTSYRAQALLAGLMFALHPAHTEVSSAQGACILWLCH